MSPRRTFHVRLPMDRSDSELSDCNPPRSPLSPPRSPLRKRKPNAKDDEKLVQQFKLYEQMADDFAQLFGSSRFSDVVLESSDGEAKFAAHRNILAARSPVFAAMFEHDMRECWEKSVRLKTVDTCTLRAMLIFIYTGSMTVDKTSPSKLLAVADQYGLISLKNICEQTLITDMNVDNAAECLVIAELHSTEQLKLKALEIIKANLRKVIHTESFKMLSVDYPKQLVDIISCIADDQYVVKNFHDCSKCIENDI